jgi:hypothetical protein
VPSICEQCNATCGVALFTNLVNILLFVPYFLPLSLIFSASLSHTLLLLFLLTKNNFEIVIGNRGIVEDSSVSIIIITILWIKLKSMEVMDDDSAKPKNESSRGTEGALSAGSTRGSN